MTITTSSGNNNSMYYPRPWDAAGIMSTYYTYARSWVEWCVSPRSFIRLSILYNANNTATTLWCPPMPANMNPAWRVTSTAVTTAGSVYYPNSTGWSQYSTTLSTSSLVVISGHTFARFTMPALSIAAAGSWPDTSTHGAVIVFREPAAIANGYGSSTSSWHYGKVSTTLFADAMPMIPSSNPTGLSTAHYNELVRALRKAEWTPCLHAYHSNLAAVSADIEGAIRLRRSPICFDQDAPLGQRTFSFVVATSSTGHPATARLIHRDREIEIPAHWSLGPMVEYRADLTDFLSGVEPDLSSIGGANRQIYYVKLMIPGDKSGYFRAMSVWSGVPA